MRLAPSCTRLHVSLLPGDACCCPDPPFSHPVRLACLKCQLSAVIDLCPCCLLLAAAGTVQVPVIETNFTSEGFEDQAVIRYMRDQSCKAFDMGAAPQMRVHVCHCPGNVHKMLFTLHHGIMDGFSMGVFWRELEVVSDRHYIHALELLTGLAAVSLSHSTQSEGLGAAVASGS
jgi:hypothetical protein